MRNGTYFNRGRFGLRPMSNRLSNGPPSFQNALNRLTVTGARRYRWQQFKPQCPVSRSHRVQQWNDPDKCPRCGLFLEKNIIPYRIWD